MKKILLVLGGGLAVFAFALVMSAMAAIDNGSFETGPIPGSFTTLNAPNTSINNWSVNSGSIDYIGSYWQASNGSFRSIDMNGLAAGSISQALTTVAGATYDITFDLSGNPDSRPSGDSLWSPSNKVIAVSATGASPQNFSYDTGSKTNTKADMRWEGHTYSFVATGTSTILTFVSIIPGAFGPALDNVSITEALPALNCPGGTTQNLAETVTVPANSSTDTLSLHPLTSGIDYILKAYGTANAGDGIEFDARYSYRTPTSIGWTDSVSTYGIHGPQLLDLFFNNSTPWGNYNNSHIYQRLTTGNGSPASFRINDIYYPNNTGDLSVDIYSCDPEKIGPPTDKNECKKDGWKTFNNPTFKNQGDCVSYVQSNEHATGNRKNNQ